MITATTWRITTTVLAGTAQLFTLSRIIYRYRKGCLWFDDMVSALAVGCALVGMVSFWFYSNGVETITHLPLDLTKAYWVVSMMFVAVVWLSRISLSLTFIRISPYDLRRLPYVVLALCSMMAIALIAQRGVLCHRDESWQSTKDPQCKNTPVLATTLALEFFSSIIMLFAVGRAYAMYDIRPVRQGTIIAIFVASLFILGGSISHAVFLIREDGLLERFTANVQSAVSLIFTNLPTLVVVSYLSFNESLDDPEAMTQIGRKKPLRGLNIGKPRALSPYSDDRESFFPSEKSVSLDPNFLQPPRLDLNYRASGISGISGISGTSSNYSQDSAFQEGTTPVTPDRPSDSSYDLAHLDPRCSGTNSPSLYSQSNRDSISAYPIVNAPSATYPNGSVGNSPLPSDGKMVRFLSKLISDEHSARMSSSQASTPSLYSAYFTDNHPSLFVHSARSSELLDDVQAVVPPSQQFRPVPF